jgi:hypothetical protein
VQINGQALGPTHHCEGRVSLAGGVAGVPTIVEYFDAPSRPSRPLQGDHPHTALTASAEHPNLARVYNYAADCAEAARRQAMSQSAPDVSSDIDFMS